MPKGNICITIKVIGSILLLLSGCSEQQTEEKSRRVQPTTYSRTPDLSKALEKRIEGNFAEAIKILRELNEEFPDSPEVLTQLGRALLETQAYPLAAFRFEQALSVGGENEIHKLAAEAHLKSGDEKNAQLNFAKSLDFFPEDLPIWLSNARLLSKMGRDTDALNAYTKASELCDNQDCLMVAELFFKKKLWTQAERWYRESAKREKSITPEPLLGLLRISLIRGQENKAETLALAIEKNNPGTIDSTDLNNEVADLLKRRRLADLLESGISTKEKGVTELSAVLLGRKVISGVSPVVSNGPKLGSLPTLKDSIENEEMVLEANTSDEIFSSEQNIFGLANAFAEPIIEEKTLSHIESSRESYLNGGYTLALFHAREALKENSSDSEAWRMCSQAHFQLGQSREAEMTILEAIRHNPFDLLTRMDYLRIARETLSPRRYLIELEKGKELFPESTEILWELARRYHLVERMPITAGILYREVLKYASAGSALHQQAQMELLKLQSQE
tara:strand:+ start:1138 stop:2655 length:1518 start_codon:yes stop_codon:yes gene_type:complete